MSTAATRLPLAEARQHAQALSALLQPVCTRLEVAGSVRRQRPDIGDLELVCIPQTTSQLDLFGDPTGEVLSLLEARVADLLQGGTLQPRLTTDGQRRIGLGPKHKALVYAGLGVDLFITSPECWGMIYLIRTGPSDFSHRLVTPRSQGGWLPDHLRVRDGRLVGTDGQPLDTPEETDVFAAIGQAWVPPEERH